MWKVSSSKSIHLISIMSLSLVLLLVGCENNSQLAIEEMDQSLILYLANNELTQLQPVKVQYDFTGNEEDIINLLTKLSEGIDMDGVKPTLPESIVVERIEVEGNKVILFLDGSYKEMNAVEELLCRSSLVRTITEIEAIDYVEIYVEGLPLMDHDGRQIGAMKSDDVIINLDNFNAEGNTKIVTLYFPEVDGSELVPVDFTFRVIKNEKIEKTIIDFLIEGPEKEGLYSAIPKETQVKNVYTNKGVCYVDLNKAFISKQLGGVTEEKLAIFSIVNSLTELPNINKVQFLIDGEVQKQYKGNMEFNGLFRRNLDIISNE